MDTFKPIFNSVNADTRYTASFDYYAFHGDRYVTGFYYAINRLIQNMGDRNEMVYPVLFMGRHFLELSLKRLIILCSKANGIPVKEYSTQHSLSKLFEEFEAIGSGYLHFFEKSGIILRSAIEELDKIDPKSFTFRYPDSFDNIDKSTTIDLENFGRIINECHWLFYELSQLFSEMLFEKGLIKDFRKHANDVRLFDRDYQIPELDPTRPLD